MKIVYNACYGGFGLSRAAVLLARKMSGNPTWGGPCIKGDIYTNGEAVRTDYGLLQDVPRHDPILVAVVEKLGKKASSDLAQLEIAEVPSGSKYRIDEYDGNESVCTPDDYDWQVAE